MEAGMEFNTNSYGVVRVLEYKTSRKVLIEFLDTGNRLVAQKDAILKGLVQDIEERTRRIQLREEAEYQAKRAKALTQAEKEAAKTAQAEAEQEHRRLRSQAVQEERHRLDEARLIGKTLTDYLGMSFTVKGLLQKRGWVVEYTESGNSYVVKEALMLRGTPHDKLRDDFENRLKEYNQRQNAAKYEANREARIAQALAYQKNNPEKSRHRNNQRRARRLGAEGSHTREETSALMETQNWKCTSCATCLRDEVPHLDHIMPLALGGSNYIENIQWLCQFCNNVKGAKHPDKWHKYIQSEEFRDRLSLRARF